jgi:ssRNA-specific RNase YbeY (16S rRNA maturation enzyme)
MQMYEVRSLLQYSYYHDKEAWEQSRLIAYITAQTQSTKRIKPTDIMTFPWEKAQENGSNEESAHRFTEIEVSQKDIDALAEKAKQMEEIFKKK